MSWRRSAPRCWSSTASAIGPSTLVALARSGERLIGSEAVQVELLPRSGHAISVDVDRDSVNAQILQWFERFAPAAHATATAGL